MIDSEHVLAELYHIVNVPTLIWIDEQGASADPTTPSSAPTPSPPVHRQALGAVPRHDPRLGARRHGRPDGRTRCAALSSLPSDATQLARAERALAWHLHGRGREEAAEHHFERAGQLAPLDWTIRRGSLPIRGKDPFGPDFFALAQEGVPTYPTEEVTPTREG